jgi:hypothetical protein
MPIIFRDLALVISLQVLKVRCLGYKLLLELCRDM